MTVELGNGVEVRIRGMMHRFDPRVVVGGDVNLVSHAHSDHVPRRFSGRPVVCSPMTQAVMRVRRKGVERCGCDAVEMLEAGHAPGSTMFLMREDGVLYTGDFCTRRKRHIPPAEPVSCDTLIVESTYGLPEFQFPDQEEVLSAAGDWVDDRLRRDGGAVLLAYPFGKAQELSFEMGDRPVRLQPTIAANNRALAALGMDLPCEGCAGLPEPPFVYITSGLGAERGKVERLAARGARTAVFSGWAARAGFAGRKGPEAFPLSDHCDYNGLMEFVRGCSPEKVYTVHGQAERFAASVRRELGIPSEALVRGQKTLGSFA